MVAVGAVSCNAAVQTNNTLYVWVQEQSSVRENVRVGKYEQRCMKHDMCGGGGGGGGGSSRLHVPFDYTPTQNTCTYTERLIHLINFGFIQILLLLLITSDIYSDLGTYIRLVPRHTTPIL